MDKNLFFANEKNGGGISFAKVINFKPIGMEQDIHLNGGIDAVKLFYWPQGDSPNIDAYIAQGTVPLSTKQTSYLVEGTLFDYKADIIDNGVVNKDLKGCGWVSQDTQAGDTDIVVSARSKGFQIGEPILIVHHTKNYTVLDGNTPPDSVSTSVSGLHTIENVTGDNPVTLTVTPPVPAISSAKTTQLILGAEVITDGYLVSAVIDVGTLRTSIENLSVNSSGLTIDGDEILLYPLESIACTIEVEFTSTTQFNYDIESLNVSGVGVITSTTDIIYKNKKQASLPAACFNGAASAGDTISFDIIPAHKGFFVVQEYESGGERYSSITDYHTMVYFGGH